MWRVGASCCYMSTSGTVAAASAAVLVLNTSVLACTLVVCASAGFAAAYSVAPTAGSWITVYSGPAPSLASSSVARVGPSRSAGLAAPGQQRHGVVAAAIGQWAEAAPVDQVTDAVIEQLDGVYATDAAEDAPDAVADVTGLLLPPLAFMFMFIFMVAAMFWALWFFP